MTGAKRVCTFFLIIMLQYQPFINCIKKHRNVRMVLWQDNPPYYLKHLKHTVFNAMVKEELLLICEQPFAMDKNPEMIETHRELVELITNKNDTYLRERLNTTSKTDEIIIIGTSSFSEIRNINQGFFRRQKIVTTKPVLLFQSGKLLLLVKFIGTFTSSLSVVIFAIMCAIIFSAVVWVIETLAGSDQFPRTPAHGIWCSFWFAIVTMTTVGYGDKTTKHPLSRLITIMWIFFGLMLVALITATAWLAIDTNFAIEGELTHLGRRVKGFKKERKELVYL